jgi:hypothetical protein
MIRILFLAANPADTSPLRLDEEIRSIDQALQQTKFRDQFRLEQHWAVRVNDLQSLLLRHQPHIVHFSGHGSSASEIILQNDDGESHTVSNNELKKLFSLLKDNIRCVILNACYSEIQAAAIAEEIDCVIGMSNEIGDQAAIQFASAFYQALGYGRDVKTAFELGRLQIDLDNLEQENIPQLLAIRADPAQVFFRAQAEEEQQTHDREHSDPLVIGVPGQSGKKPKWLVPRIQGLIWSAIIGAIATIIAAIAPSLIDSLREPTAISETPLVTATLPVITIAPTPISPLSIQSIVQQRSLSLDDVAVISEYLAGPAPEEEKWDIILALGKPGWSNVVFVLQEVLIYSRDTTTKQNAVLALKTIGPLAQSALLWALDYDPNDSILRINVINALGDLPDEHHLAVYKLQSILVNPREVPIVVRIAVEALGRLNAVPAVNDIINVLSAHDQIVRTQAAQTLSRFDLPQVKAALRQAVKNDPIVDTRLAAINSLVILRDEEALSLFTQLQVGDEPDAIRNAAKEAIYRLSGQGVKEADTEVAVQPTATVEEIVSGLSLKKGMKGFSQGVLVVQLIDGSSDTSATYDVGTRVQFVLAAPDKAELALVELPDGKQGWITISSVEWSASTTTAPQNVLWPNGKVIKIAFLDGEEELQKKVERYAQEWTKYANLAFDFGEYKDAEVRVSFEQPGSWSYPGAMALNVPANQPTINLGWLRPNTDEEEIKRVVLQQFGHVIGLLHEMLNPNNTIPWDKKAVYDLYEGPPNNWTKEQVDRSIFEYWAPGTYPAEKEFDRNSIMLFPVSNELTYGDYEIGWNRELSEGDKAFAAMLYPKPLTATGDDAGIHYTWFGNISPSVVGIASSAAEASAGNEILMNGEIFGAFSGTFLPLLRDEKADLNRDGYVSLDEAVLVTGMDLKKQNFQQSPLIVGEDKEFPLFSLQPNAQIPSRPQRLEVLLVGINDYAMPIPVLRGPVNDVKLLEKLLTEEEYVAADEVNITLLTDQAASTENIWNALKKLIEEADSSTAIIFYFSGHNSVKESQASPKIREKAIVPVDATDAQHYISVAEIAALLAQSSAKHKILIIDA